MFIFQIIARAVKQNLAESMLLFMDVIKEEQLSTIILLKILDILSGQLPMIS
jgi:hypothetical protein